VNSAGELQADHAALGTFLLSADGAPEILFTNNETNTERIWQWRGENRSFKDAFHEYLIQGRQECVNPQQHGTKSCAVYPVRLMPGPRPFYISVYAERVHQISRAMGCRFRNAYP
jgi:hypothetical protein